jgi:hypothetical protein
MATPDQLDALRRSFGPQRAGLMLAFVGVLAAILRGTALPTLPRLLPLVLIATALGLIGLGVLRRLRAYRGRGR